MSSENMLDPIIRALVGADLSRHRLIFDIVNKLGGSDAEAVRVRLARALRGTSSTKTQSDYLTHFISITLDPTNGNVTIAEAKDVFTGYTDPNFKNWGTNVNVVGQDTEAQSIEVYEVEKEGTSAQLFGSLGDPRSLCLTQGQIVEVCRMHWDQLCQVSYGNFFLFEVRASC